MLLTIHHLSGQGLIPAAIPELNRVTPVLQAALPMSYWQSYGFRQ